MNNLPLFYNQPVAFDTAVHGALQFSEAPPEFSFAASANAIPLLVGEVAHAVRHYPLVFVPGIDNTAPVLVALVGLGDNVNRFVDSQGQWRADTYVPAYVRRYPFLPLQTPGQAEPILGIDLSAPWVHTQAGEAFVDATGHATPRLERVMTFQNEYQQQAEATAAMCIALQGAEVMVAQTLQWLDARGERQQLDGFLCVDEGKLKALLPDALVTLHRADAMGLAYAQLLSMSNFNGLVTVATQFPTVPRQVPPVRNKKISRKKISVAGGSVTA